MGVCTSQEFDMNNIVKYGFIQIENTENLEILTNEMIYKSKTYRSKNKYITLVSLGIIDHHFQFVGKFPDYFHDKNQVNVLYKNIIKHGKTYSDIYQIYNITEKKLYIPSVNKTYLPVYEKW